jgi:hypothetical protein
VAESTTKPNWYIVGDFVLELSAANSKIATNNILKVLGCAVEILPAFVSADKK